MENTSKINKFITIFFIVVFFLHSLFRLGLFTLVGLAWGNSVGLLGAPLALVFYFLFWKAYASARQRGIRPQKIHFRLVILSVIFIFAGTLLLSLDGGLYFTLPPVLTALSAYIIWTVYGFSERRFAESYKKILLTLVIGSLLSGILIGSVNAAEQLTNKLENYFTERTSKLWQEDLKKNLVISDTNDRLIYTTKGNPIGVSVNFNAYSETEFPLTEQKLLENRLRSSVAGMGSFDLDLSSDGINIDPSLSQEKGGVRNVIIYSIPRYLRGATISREGIVDLSTACNGDRPTDNLEIIRLNMAATYIFYPIWPDEQYSIKTKNSYVPMVFYESTQKENIKSCTDPF